MQDLLTKVQGHYVSHNNLEYERYTKEREIEIT
jgi:hypothetical protein